VPILHVADPSTHVGTLDHPHHVAIHGLGTGHGWPFLESTRGYDHLLMAVDKFSKWIEAKPVAQISSDDTVEFFLDIIYRFGVPNYIISDNETQFMGKKFLHFCDDYHIRVDWASIAHP
jgi:hypothetical protein